MSVAAIIGGGVIGGGWAARFLLAGWDVRVFDPDPDAQRKIGEVLGNARRSLPGMYAEPLPPQGRLSFHAKMSDAVEGASWIQESVPERLELKRKIYQQLQAQSSDRAIIGSSTSGFTPSQIQGCATRPGEIVVAHPFNPVYLLPLVELVGSPANAPQTLERAEDIMRSVGMFPLRIRAEIDAHIADRLLEAVWREALWLIHDDIATTAEIDEAIRMGFGLRWAQMGLFETYRIAGGEAGMAHFIAQFGPALEWPWTRLMDVPELTPDLIAKIAAQSDAQSGARSVRELERIRDANLVTILRGLKAQRWGAGQVIAAYEAGLRETAIDIARPIPTARRAVPLDWADYNGHMNEARYLEAFAEATDRFMEIAGCDADYIATGGSYFTAETHIRHLGEVHIGQDIEIDTLCLEGAGKKMHLFHEMRVDGALVATGEHMLVHVSLKTRAAAAPGPEVAEKLARIAAAHAGLPRPEGIGRAVGQGR